MDLPKLSVVTVTFNAALYLEESLRSILLQGYPNLEIVIIDGGSTDGTVEIIRKYESWIAYWVSEPDRGQSHAINKGWAAATGEWLGWLNADDIYVKGVFSRVSTLFIESEQVDLVYGDVLYVDASGAPRDINIKSPFSLRDMVLKSGLIHTPSVFWRKRLNDSAGWLDENQHYAMDNDFWLRVAPAARCHYLPGIMGTFRRHDGSKTVNSELKLVSENLEIHAKRLREPPYVSFVTEPETHMVLGGFAWQLGVLLLRIGKKDEASRHFKDAIDVHRILDTPDVAALRTVKSVLENQVLERLEIDSILAALPLDNAASRRFRSLVWDQYWQIRFYGAFQNGDSKTVIRSALPLLLAAPGRIAQRGFLSICARSFVALVMSH